MFAMRPRRRRPLLRGAVVGGAGYMAGKSAANRKTAEQQQDAQIAELQAQQAQQQAPPAPPQQAPPQPAPGPQAAPAGAAGDTTAELERLAGLHQQGVLSDEEFAAAKKKVLGL